ncbi:MAG TPA: Ig-like domain-containing protein [Gammaproteobacteria bacterium]|nr:Ig-like domain-containing protein [Gammaproteobacteria bacterium]
MNSALQCRSRPVPKRPRIIVAVPLAWLLICGSSFVSCSSGSGEGIFDPRPDNRAPVAFDSSLTATANTAMSGFMQAVDDDGDPLSFGIVTGPDSGTVRIDNAATGAFTYTGSAAGTDRFSFQADDGLARSNIATVTVTVHAARLAHGDGRARL